MLAQTGTDFEIVIIVDDHSNDDTPSVAAGIADARIRFQSTGQARKIVH